MILTDKGGDFEQPPIGIHVARSIRLIDIGTQKSDYQGTVTHKRQFILTWELSNEMMTRGENEGQPFVVSKFYTASLSEKSNLRKDLVSWRGREFTSDELGGFDPRNILDKPCMVQIIDKEGKHRVASVTGVPKGTQVPPAFNAIQYFSLDDFDAALFASLSDRMKELITKSPEYKRAAASIYGEPEQLSEDVAF